MSDTKKEDPVSGNQVWITGILALLCYFLVRECLAVDRLEALHAEELRLDLDHH